MKNTFLSEMNVRGFLNQCTDLEKLEKISIQKPIKAYIGFDSTPSENKEMQTSGEERNRNYSTRTVVTQCGKKLLFTLTLLQFLLEAFQHQSFLLFLALYCIECSMTRYRRRPSFTFPLFLKLDT